MQALDPLAVIETDTPCFSKAEAIAIVADSYGLDVSVKQLISERDQNFHLRQPDGPEYVLKIANTMEDPLTTEFQIDALLHLERVGSEQPLLLSAPRVLRTVNGKSHVKLTSDLGDHIARVVSYVDGVPLGDRVPSAALATNMGIFLAHLGRALESFTHPGSSPSLLWDMQQALRLRDLLRYVNDLQLRKAIVESLDEFERDALPGFPSLRSQVIHSDFNPDNVLVDKLNADKVAGVIDFGDMLHAPLVVDAAIGASYLRVETGNPLALISSFLIGYHSVTPLYKDEIDMLLTLIKTRIAASVCILFWRAAHRGGDDPYLKKHLQGEFSAAKFLLRLAEMPLDSAAQTFRQVCATTQAES